MDFADLINHLNCRTVLHKPEGNGSTHKAAPDHTYIIFFVTSHNAHLFPLTRISPKMRNQNVYYLAPLSDHMKNNTATIQIKWFNRNTG